MGGYHDGGVTLRVKILTVFKKPFNVQHNV